MPKTTNYAKMIGGKKVVNGTRRVKLHITAADIKAKKGDPQNCAAAKAALRQVPNCVAARVHVGRVYLLKDDGKWHRYMTPDALRTEIVSFDRGGKFIPGDYELVPMPPSSFLPKKRTDNSEKDPDRGRGDHPGKQPRKFHVTQGVRKGGTNTIYR